MKHMLSLLLLLSSHSLFAVNTQKIQYHISLEKLLNNISPPGTKAGAVVASPSRSYPDYWYHWVRDAALVMREVSLLAQQEYNQQQTYGFYSKKMFDYADFVSFLQMQNTISDLGEPKYYVDGTGFYEQWGRPQNDGPALRAITFIHWAHFLLDQNAYTYVTTKLYNPNLPGGSIIKNDLEYTSHYWQEDNYDYWEEVKGQHFANLAAQRSALLAGAQLARRLGDLQAANWYEQQGNHIAQRLLSFWDQQRQTLIPTTSFSAGLDYKTSGVDITTLLALLHSDLDDLYPLESPKVLSTVTRLVQTFRELYPINNGSGVAVMMGRYPEDQYDGIVTYKQGHGWFLATFAMAEYLMQLRHKLITQGGVTIAPNSQFYRDVLGLQRSLNAGYYSSSTSTFRAIIEALEKVASAYILKADEHASDRGEMDEQANRYTGFMQGARDLTWSYASHLSALRALRL